jgi:CheY-like chemotaxis protein
MSISIMVVDDDPGLRTLLSLILQRAGYTVQLAENGAEALERIQATPPDAFLLDVMMPGMDGVELCRRIRATALTAKAPVFMVSGYADPTNVQRSFEAGATDFLSKPVTPRDLIKKLQEALGQT